jgi:hypothetical protein
MHLVFHPTKQQNKNGHTKIQKQKKEQSKKKTFSRKDNHVTFKIIENTNN